ncbi:MAG TPA: DUF4124 domain-containing protein [Azospira sp.]|nr:DUF4124 domain-containing protein [Azospira sp.]
MKPFAPLRTALLLALVVALPAQAQIYQYKDASGKTVISDRPPPPGKTPAKTYSAGGNASDGSAAANGTAEATEASPSPTAGPKTLAERELEFKKRQKEQKEAADKAQKEAATQATRKDECERAKRQLQVLESGERVTMRDEKGERVFIEDEQRAAEIERTRKHIADACK